MILTEDDIYRASTQYRLWSFTPESLASLRESTNKSAAERVKAAVARLRDGKEAPDPTDPASFKLNVPKDPSQIDCLTPYEELKLLTYYTRQCIALSQSAFQFPRAVTSTACVYLRRFYLSNSPMTYHPKSIFPTAIFLATKTENYGISLNRFVQKIKEQVSKSKLGTEDVLAPEFLLMQGMRFTFDVRHPFMGLSAAWMELIALARADQDMVPASMKGSSATVLQERMLTLQPAPAWMDRKSGAMQPAGRPCNSAVDLEKRAGIAHDRAKEMLTDAALLTDVYFLYTPAQIWLAALLVADEPLTLFYLGTKLPIDSTDFSDEKSNSQALKVVSTVRACADMVGSYHPNGVPREELVRIDKKLYQCQNPEKRDLVGLNRAKKQDDDGAGGDVGAKNRRIEGEREKGNVSDDVFGGDLPHQ